MFDEVIVLLRRQRLNKVISWYLGSRYLFSDNLLILNLLPKLIAMDVNIL